MPAPTLPTGTIVRYHGRLTDHHGIYLIAGTLNGVYLLQEYNPMCPDRPTSILRHVDPRHVTSVRHKPAIIRHHNGPGAAACTHPRPQQCTARSHLTYTAECECGWMVAHNVRRRVEEARNEHLEDTRNAEIAGNLAWTHQNMQPHQARPVDT